MQRQRRAYQLLSAAAALGLVVLVLCFTGLQQSAEPISAAPSSLGLPSDALALAQLSAGGGQQAQQQGQQGQQQPGSGWWSMWQQRMSDQEARVASWRNRQRSVVYEETAAEQAQAAATTALLGSGLTRAASALGRAAAADPFLEADAAKASQGLSAVARGLPLQPLGEETQQEAAAALASGSAAAAAAEE